MQEARDPTVLRNVPCPSGEPGKRVRKRVKPGKVKKRVKREKLNAVLFRIPDLTPFLSLSDPFRPIAGISSEWRLDKQSQLLHAWLEQVMKRESAQHPEYIAPDGACVSWLRGSTERPPLRGWNWHAHSLLLIIVLCPNGVS